MFVWNNGDPGQEHNKKAVPKLHKANIQKATLRQHLFSAKENPGIPLIKRIAYWTMVHWPDIMGWFDWKRTARKLVTIFIILYLASELLFNFSMFNLILKLVTMILFAGLLYAKNISFMVYGFMEKWESFA